MTHNALGLRGNEVGPKREFIRRLVTVGGSSTYCVKVSDDEAWPAILGRALGPEWEVINAGVPGYGTAEHVIQTTLCMTDLQPDVCLYYVGWNDARNSHILGLKSDYSDFHGPTQAASFELGEPVGVFARVGVLRAAAKLFFKGGHSLARDRPRRKPTSTALTSALDPRALSLFERNLKTIIASSRVQGFQCVFVPQAINHHALTADRPYGWLPFVRDKDLPGLIDAYNATLARVCSEEGSPYLDISKTDFLADDFLDQGHFSVKGNERFAGLMFERLRARQ